MLVTYVFGLACHTCWFSTIA